MHCFLCGTDCAPSQSKPIEHTEELTSLSSSLRSSDSSISDSSSGGSIGGSGCCVVMAAPRGPPAAAGVWVRPGHERRMPAARGPTPARQCLMTCKQMTKSAVLHLDYPQRRVWLEGSYDRLLSNTWVDTFHNHALYRPSYLGTQQTDRTYWIVVQAREDISTIPRLRLPGRGWGWGVRNSAGLVLKV
jgi:hypothetical protein